MNFKSFFFFFISDEVCVSVLFKDLTRNRQKAENFGTRAKSKTRFNQISKAHSEFQNKIKRNSFIGNKVECLQGYKTSCSTITVLSLLQEHISSWSSTPFLNHLRGLWPRMRRKT